MRLRVGDSVDDVHLLRPDGSAMTLSAFAGQPLLVIFLRHLA